MGLRLHYFTAAQTAGAHTHALVAMRGFGVYRTKINVPAPLSDIVRVADFIAGKRLLAANFTNLCHGLGSDYEFWRERSRTALGRRTVNKQPQDLLKFTFDYT